MISDLFIYALQTLVLQVLSDTTTRPEFEVGWIMQLQKEAITAIYR